MTEFEKYFNAMEEIQDFCNHNENCNDCMFKNSPFCNSVNNPRHWHLNSNRKDFIFKQN